MKREFCTAIASEFRLLKELFVKDKEMKDTITCNGGGSEITFYLVNFYMKRKLKEPPEYKASSMHSRITL